MFDIGFWELAVIGVIALLVVGPDKMPTLVRTAGQWAGKAQRMARELRRELEQAAQTEEYKALNQEFLAEDVNDVSLGQRWHGRFRNLQVSVGLHSKFKYTFN